LEAVAFAQTREAGPRTRWFIATGTAAASRCIKVNTQPPAGPNRPAPNRHGFPHLSSHCRAACPSPAAPRPAPPRGRGSLGEPRGGCGPCMWEKVRVACHVIARSLSSVIWPLPAPGSADFAGQRPAPVGWGGVERVRGRGRVLGPGVPEPQTPPLSCRLLSAAVSADFLWRGAGAGLLGEARVALPVELGEGEVVAAVPRAFWQTSRCCR
jgi:hypothetical protein